MQVTIDDHTIEVSPESTVLDAIHLLGQDVPTLCYDDRQAAFGACRVCLVGAEGAPGPVPACTTPCRDGMRIDTHDPTARRVAAAVVELVLSELPVPPAPHTELAAVAGDLGVRSAAGDGPALRWTGLQHEYRHDDRHPYLAFQHELCISCGRCVRACDEVQGAFALTATGRGFSANVTAGLDAGFRDSTCVSCGACADTCPTDAIIELTLLRLDEDRGE
jgi:predicted molibdopterin-dependent oxidoreductase YjgC